MFHSLALTELEQLAEIMREEVVPSGRVLFDVGDPGASMYIVKSGRIRISIPGDSGEEVPLAHLGPGEFFGELALLDGQPRSARASAEDETTLWVLSRDTFLSFIGTRPATALAMLSATAKRLRHTDELMRSRASFDVNEEIKRTETMGDRIADRLARMAGSWTFIAFFIASVIGWIAIQTISVLRGQTPFDEFPYQFFGFLMGVLASLQAPIIMMSQNRDQIRDRIRADADFKINLKNEMAIEKALERLDELKRQIPELRRQIREQEIALRKHGDAVAEAVASAARAAAAAVAARPDGGAAPASGAAPPPLAPEPAAPALPEVAAAPPGRRWTRGGVPKPK